MSIQAVNSIDMTLKFQLSDSETCTLLHDALVLESGYNPNDRAQVRLKTEGNYLILKIQAKDITSARASINSFLKWINLSLQVISITDKKGSNKD